MVFTNLAEKQLDSIGFDNNFVEYLRNEKG